MNSAEPLVSIIVPVYNAEKTLEEALTSLRKQSYRSLELVFVNDCSVDQSLAMLERFAMECATSSTRIIKILNHESNKGVASARNTGLEEATGEYIYYVDADDTLEYNAIELLVDRALTTNADIVGCNWFLSFEKNERKMNQPSFSSPMDALEKLLQGNLRWNLWLFLVKRSLYFSHELKFIPGMNMGEDMMMMIKLFTIANRVSYLDEALYHYGQSNSESLTKVYSQKHREQVSANLIEVERFLSKSRFAKEIIPLIDFLKLNIKLPLLISDKTQQYELWRSWFSEVNDKVSSNKAVSLRIRLLQWAAANRQDWLIKIHYYVFVRLVYGLIYR